MWTHGTVFTGEYNEKEVDGTLYGVIMIYFQWFTQIWNQFYVNKILLSFLIAIIGKSLAR